MKRLLILALAIIFCMLTFVACDKKDSDDEASSGTESESTQENGDESSSESGGSEDNADQEKCEHVEEIVKGIEPTCTENGLTDGKKCSLCGKELVAQQTIITQGHIATEIKGTPATCSEAGLTNGMKCSVCGEILQEQKVIEALPHEYDYYGACHGCSKKIGEAVLVVLDISSSMKRPMGEGSRFTVSRDVILEFIADFREYDYFGLVLFDAETHVAMDLAKIEDKEKFISELEYNLNHMYYCYYLDENGKETEIVVNEADGDKYTSLGYIYPVGYKSNNFDETNGNYIRTYGTAYMGAIQTAGQMFDNFKHEAISKKLVFVSDGEPMDKGIGYDAILERLASRDIVTTTVGLGVNGTGAEQELRLMASAGNGVYRPTTNEYELALQLLLAYRKADLDGKFNKINGFTFFEYEDDVYLIDYDGKEKNLTLPKNYKGGGYKLITGAIANNDYIQSLVIPSAVIGAPAGAVTNCKNLITVTIEENVVVSSGFISSCLRLCEIYNLSIESPFATNYLSQQIKYGQYGFSHPAKIHTSIDAQSYVKITNDGYVFTLPGASSYEDGYDYTKAQYWLIGYVGNEKNLVLPEVGPYGLPYGIDIGALAYLDIESLVIPELTGSNRSIPPVFVYGCESLNSVTFSGNAINISSNAFMGATSLKSVTFSGNTISISSNAFMGATSLKSVNFSDNVKSVSIGNNAFDGTSLTGIKFPEGVTSISIGSYAFNGCTFNSLEFPKSATLISIGNSAFVGCSSLEKLTIPDGVESVSIGNNAFEGCTALEILEIPSKVPSITIGKLAFFDCTLIKSVEFTENETIDIDVDAFSPNTKVSRDENNRFSITYYVQDTPKYVCYYSVKGEKVALSTSAYGTVPSGDTFFGWVTDKGEVYAPGATVEVTEDMALYAAIGREISNASDLISYLGSGSCKYVRLTADITATQNIAAYYNTGCYATIDLNGHTITSSGVSYAFGSQATGIRFVGDGTVSFTSSSSSGAFYTTSYHGYWESRMESAQQLLIGKNVKVVSNVPLVRVTNSIASEPGWPPIDIYGEVVAPALIRSSGGDNIEISLYDSCKVDLSSGTVAPLRDTSSLDITVAVLTIYGGEIKLSTNFEGLLEESESRIRVIIRGGSFNVDVSEYLYSSYKVEYNNGLYNVVVK